MIHTLSDIRWGGIKSNPPTYTNEYMNEKLRNMKITFCKKSNVIEISG